MYKEFDSRGLNYIVEKVNGPKHSYRKIDEAFNAESGVCYIDDKGRKYTYDDLMCITRDKNTIKELYRYLCGETPEETMESSMFFQKCKRCGTWKYAEFSISREKDPYCRFCTPLRTGGKIDLWEDPYDDDRKFFAKKQAAFEPGITTLVGCNGAGKTTLIENIKSELEKRGTPYICYDNLGKEGGENGAKNLLSAVLGGYRKADTDETLGFFSESLASSEGEKIVSALNRFSSKIAKMIKDLSGYGELWLLFDAVDSGLSVDMIDDVKKYLLDPVNELNGQDIRVYLILSSNSYEMSEGTKCFSVEKMKYIPVKNYKAFHNAVLSSRRYKRKRDDVFRVKREIAERPYDFIVDAGLLDESDSDKKKGVSGDLLTAELYPYRLVVHRGWRNWSYRDRYYLYKKENGMWKKIQCDFEEPWSLSDPEEIREDVHEYLCRKVFLYERPKKHAANT